MKKLHHHLSSKYAWYRNWHQKKNHNMAHWAVALVAIGAALALILQGGVSSKSLGASVQNINTANPWAIMDSHRPLYGVVVGGNFYVSNQDGTMSVINTATKATTTTISVDTAQLGESVRVGTKLYVPIVVPQPEWQFSTIAVIDTANNTVVTKIALGAQHYALAAVGAKVYATNVTDGKVTVIDTTTNAISASIPVGGKPMALAQAGSSLYVGNQSAKTVSVINSTTNAVIATIPVTLPPTAMNMVGSDLYVWGNVYNQGNSAFVINTNPASPTYNTVTSTIPFSANGNIFSPITIGADIYFLTNANSGADHVDVFNTTSKTITSTIGVGSHPRYMTLAGTQLFVANQGGTSVIDINSKTVVRSVGTQGSVDGGGGQISGTPSLTYFMAPIGSEVYAFQGTYILAIPTDVTPPSSISLVSPASGATIWGPTQFVATANDNVGIKKIEFYWAPGGLIGTATSDPFQITWDPGTIERTITAFKVKAYDGAGNTIESDPITFNVSNAPTVPGTVTFTAPTSGAVVPKSATNTISVDTTNLTGVAKILFLYGNNMFIGQDTAAPYSVNWDTRYVVTGPQMIIAKAIGAGGNLIAQTSIPVNVGGNAPLQGDTIPPTVTMTAPAGGGASVSGIITVSATATDNTGITRVDFYRGTTLISSDTNAPYSIVWNTANVPNGSYAISAKGYDFAGNVGTAPALSVVVANVAPEVPTPPNNPPSTDTTAPTATITVPTPGNVSGSVRITVSATDNVKVAKVEFYLNGTLYAIDSAPGWSWNWVTSSLPNGAYSIVTKAYDAAGNVGVSPAVNVMVNN